MSIVIRHMKREEIDEVVQWTTAEGWTSTLEDVLVFFDTQPEGWFAAELDGTLAGCLCGIRHGDNHGCVGMIIVKSDCRGKGLARNLMETMQKYLAMGNSRRNVGLSAREHVMPVYARYGFKISSWELVAFRGTPQLENLEALDTNSVQIVPTTEVDFDKLAAYDTRIHVVPRLKYLQLHLSKSHTISYCALKGEEIVGYGVIQPANGGHNIAPLYADVYDTAKLLVKKLIESLPKVETLKLEGPDTNTKLMDLAKKLNLVEAYRLRRQYSQADIPLPCHKVFAVANNDVTFV